MKKYSDDTVFNLVKSGYNKIAKNYVEKREKINNWKEVKDFCSKLPEMAKKLDVGCGTGIPIAKYLIKK